MGVMDFSMMQSAQGDDKFVTDFHAHGAGLCEGNVMGIGRPPCAFQAQLVGVKFEVAAVADTPWIAER